MFFLLADGRISEARRAALTRADEVSRAEAPRGFAKRECKWPLVTTRKRQACFGGTIRFYSHDSTETRPRDEVLGLRAAECLRRGRFRALYFLAGLTWYGRDVHDEGERPASCRRSSGSVLVAPDTSPRGLGLPGEEDSWDFGTGAGFYLDAEAEPWRGTIACIPT